MNPNTGELRLIERGERAPRGLEPVPAGFLERVARDELRNAQASGQESAYIDLRTRHPLAKWASKVRAAKKRKAKLAAASRRRNRK